MSAINKRALVECGLVKEFCKARYASIRGDRSLMDELEDNVGLEVVDACRQVYSTRLSRIKRCKVKVAGLVFDSKASFLTFTFSDKALSRTTPLTRRRAVRKCLKKVSKGGKFIANVDFGDKNEREHYHGICEVVDIDALKKYWEKYYGWVKIKPVRSSDQDLKRTVKYINKLTSHAFKDSVHMHRVIYSRRSRLPRVAEDVDEVDDVLIVPFGTCAP